MTMDYRVFLLTGCIVVAGMPSVLANATESMPVVNEFDRRLWVGSKVSPVYPRRMGRKGREGCVNVSFIVQQDGTVSDPVVVKARPRKGFVGSSFDAVKKFKYTPTPDNTDRQPIRTGHTFVYMMETSNATKRKRDHIKWLKQCFVDLTQVFKDK